MHSPLAIKYCEDNRIVIRKPRNSTREYELQENLTTAYHSGYTPAIRHHAPQPNSLGYNFQGQNTYQKPRQICNHKRKRHTVCLLKSLTSCPASTTSQLLETHRHKSIFIALQTPQRIARLNFRAETD
jgi:hypothetical protein